MNIAIDQLQLTDLLAEQITLSLAVDDDGLLDFTIGYCPESKKWGWQTGDNSYTGGAYPYPIRGTVTYCNGDDFSKIAQDLINQILDLIDD